MKVYQDLIAEYIDCHGLEAELMEWRESMRILRKNPRTLRPNKFIDDRAKAREDINSLQTDRLSRVETLKTDPLEFFRQVLGVESTDYEKELIEFFQKNQFVAARWNRQSGKVLRRLEFCSIMP